ncbi:hypothetical protein SSX86_001414 [Deinandra increscens subsp. villosa]|uniref:Gag protein n=1 Tax=Deinandra increscens subsp. villosa TaxID=3103831 RepID=A0AAP0HCI9_9ASTR
MVAGGGEFSGEYTRERSGRGVQRERERTERGLVHVKLKTLILFFSHCRTHPLLSHSFRPAILASPHPSPEHTNAPHNSPVNSDHDSDLSDATSDATMAEQQLKEATDKLSHAYSVTNIHLRVKILDGIKINYNLWIKLFLNHVRAYKVLDHIDGTDPPEDNDPLHTIWNEIDAVVLQWIYSTLSDSLLPRVVENEQTARDAWVKIQNIFQNNKGSRAVALEQEFINLTLASCASMDAYFQKIHELGEQLTDIGRTVDESRKVLQLVRGLPPEYDTVAALINQGTPTWDEARNMIQLEMHRIQARQNPNQSVLIANQQPHSRNPIIPKSYMAPILSSPTGIWLCVLS